MRFLILLALSLLPDTARAQESAASLRPDRVFDGTDPLPINARFGWKADID